LIPIGRNPEKKRLQVETPGCKTARSDYGQDATGSLFRNIVNAWQANRTYMHFMMNEGGALHGEQGIFEHGADFAPYCRKHDAGCGKSA
jgi:hypothetical protein